MGAFTEHVFRTFDLNRIEVRVFARNTGSARVFERNGYTLEGRFRNQIVKDGELLDGLLYAILVSDVRPHGSGEAARVPSR